MKMTRIVIVLLNLQLLVTTISWAQTPAKGFVKIFDGKTMKGWDADTSFWRVEAGTLVGQVKPGQKIPNNTFLIWKGGQPADFEFKAEFRINAEGNSGVNYRSELVEGIQYALKGYQADIDGANQYTGQNYEERGRGFLAMRGQKALLTNGKAPIIQGSVGNSDSLKTFIKTKGWNTIHLIVKGNRMLHYINGKLMSETIDEDTVARKMKGFLGLQVHVMEKMKVEYRNIFLKLL